LIVESLESKYGVRAITYAGTRALYHSTAVGKAMLAHFPEQRRREIYEYSGLPILTDKTITDPEVLENQIPLIMERGYAFDEEENELSAYCVGMPIIGPFGEVLGAISVAGLQQRMNELVIEKIVALLKIEISEIEILLAGN